MATVTLEQVTKVYPNGSRAVTDVSLEVADGEFLILVGPSGCGKTTLLRMVAGLEEITSGRVLVGDRVVNHLGPKERDVAMVFQNYALYPHMTVAQNIGFALALKGVPKPAIEAKVAEAAKILGLSEQLRRKPNQLSGGQRQRVAMGRAIVREPSVFLMDEPLSNLDAKLRVQMRAEVSRIQRQVGVATLYVTHDQTEAMTMGDRVAVLQDGLLQQCASPEELYERPANLFVAAFIGSPPMNLYQAQLAAGGDELRLGSQAIALPESLRRSQPLRAYRSKAVVAGIRPEDLSVDLGGPRDAGRGTLHATVDLVESLGSEKLVHFGIDAVRVHADGAVAGGTAGDGTDPSDAGEMGAAPSGGVARIGRVGSVAPGRRATLAVDLERLHFFDPVTGLAVHSPLPGP